MTSIPHGNLSRPSELLLSLDDFCGDDSAQSLGITAWVNSVVSFPPPDGPGQVNGSKDLLYLDKQIAQLIAALEVACEENSTNLGHLVDDVSRGIPRLAYDLHFMREGSLSLQEILCHVEATSITPSQSSTKLVLDRLHLLDTMKTNMGDARGVLREAESWSMLEPEVTTLLAERNYERAAEKLAEASENIFVFQNTQEYESRRSVVVSLENQLEASLSSPLVTAIHAGDTKVCREYFSIFSRIRREVEFFNYYVGSRTERLVVTWRDLDARESDSSFETSNSLVLASSLPEFYSSFRSVIFSERTSISEIFPEPRTMLSLFISCALSSLQPSFSQNIAAMANNQGSTAIIPLVSSFKTTEAFAKDVYQILKTMNSMSQTSDDLALGTTRRSSEKAHSRRHSRRMSMSFASRVEMKSSHSIIPNVSASPSFGQTSDDWDLALFEPFIEAQTSYPSLERRYLEAKLSDILGDDDLLKGDIARSLRDKMEKFAELAESALTRCMEFTYGYALPGLLQVLDNLFISFVQSVKDRIFADKYSFFRSPGNTSAVRDELFDLDYDTEDWSQIQQLLHLVDSTRIILERLTALEGKVQSVVSQALGENDITRSDASGVQPAGMTSGELHLLVQSALNTRELHDLLQSILPRTDDSGDRSAPSLSGTLTTQGHPELFNGMRKATVGLAGTFQKSLQDVILSPLVKRLRSYPALSVWTNNSDPNAKNSGKAGELQIPVFSLSPSDTMQRVAEGLLNLPRLFEVYADDDVLAFSVETLPFAETELARVLSEESQQLATAPSQGQSRRSGSLSLRPIQRYRPLTPEMILSIWLSSLGHSLVSNLLNDVLPKIQRLTSGGSAQLASDLGYLENIVQALNVEDEDLKKWRMYAEMDDTEGEALSREQRSTDPILSHVARMRGWPQ